MDQTGYLKTKDKTTKTNLSGVFACGDIQDKAYRQVVKVAGTVCFVALYAACYLGALE